ncbi:winged helix-turn-helix domain-containing protein [Methanosarcina sp. MTP4]|uniref:winged helix-turn-helix domain-containing protein n=1 Tax=Methanosarcina sp. MTP4 TaxID=1434100 RepID=UPI000B25BF05|nr:winged helix-turn-helix domain-containing protein [Methanosarcina sp. MTP4]
MKPFEGLLGNNCELRIIEFLLPLEGIEFNVTELAEEVGVSRPSVIKSIKKFLEWGLIKSKRAGNLTYYSMNHESPIIKNIQQLNNLLIEKMLGDDVLYEIHEYIESKSFSVETSATKISLNRNFEMSNWSDSFSTEIHKPLWCDTSFNLPDDFRCSEPRSSYSPSGAT